MGPFPTMERVGACQRTLLTTLVHYLPAFLDGYSIVCVIIAPNGWWAATGDRESAHLAVVGHRLGPFGTFTLLLASVAC